MHRSYVQGPGQQQSPPGLRGRAPRASPALGSRRKGSSSPAVEPTAVGQAWPAQRASARCLQRAGMSQRIGKLCRIKEKAMSQQTTAHPDAALYFAMDLGKEPRPSGRVTAKPQPPGSVANQSANSIQPSSPRRDHTFTSRQFCDPLTKLLGAHPPRSGANVNSSRRGTGRL